MPDRLCLDRADYADEVVECFLPVGHDTAHLGMTKDKLSVTWPIAAPPPAAEPPAPNPLHGILDDGEPLTHRPGEYMGIAREGVVPPAVLEHIRAQEDALEQHRAAAPPVLPPPPALDPRVKTIGTTALTRLTAADLRGLQGLLVVQHRGEEIAVVVSYRDYLALQGAVQR